MVTVAFDVDGCLRQAKGAVPVADEDIRTLLRLLKERFGCRIVVWSGSGQLYAAQIGSALHVSQWVDQYAAKGSVAVDLTVDDAEMTLGTLNLTLKL